jgi:hypothetical protein
MKLNRVDFCVVIISRFCCPTSDDPEWPKLLLVNICVILDSTNGIRDAVRVPPMAVL